MLAIAGVLGGVVWSRMATLKRRAAEKDNFSRLMIESQETERKRIAAELHDGVGQILVVIRNRALLGLRGERDEDQARRQMEEIAGSTTQAMDEIRKVAYNLRPYQLDRLGLTRAIEALVEQVGASSEIEIVAALDPLDGVFPREDEIHVYRIVQEAVSNLVRHGQASVARVAARVGAGEVEIAIDDDGRGFDATTPRTGRPGMGLSGIAERARILGGRVSIQSAPRQGTRVTVWLPRKEAAS